MPLLFLRDDEKTDCLKFQNGDVIKMSELPRLTVSKPTEGMLNELTSSELWWMMNKLYITGVPKSAKKPQMVSAILRGWERVVMCSASSSATTLEREEARQRKRDEAFRKRLEEEKDTQLKQEMKEEEERFRQNPPTTFGFNSSGRLVSVNETRYDKDDNKEVEPEPEEPEPITWTANDEKALQFLTTLNENSDFAIDYDRLEALKDKKKKYEEEQKRLSSQTASASAGYVETAKEEASDEEWANCSLQDVMNFADEDDIINKGENFSPKAYVKTIWLVRSLDKKDGVAVRMDWKKDTIGRAVERLEDWGGVPNAEDFIIFYKGKKVSEDVPLKDLISKDAPMSDCVFLLKMKRLRGGGVSRAIKKPERLMLLRAKAKAFAEKIVQDDLAKKCQAKANETLAHPASNLVCDTINKSNLEVLEAMKETWDNGSVNGDRFAGEFAPHFLGLIGEVNEKIDQLVDARKMLVSAFEVKFSEEFLVPSGRYNLTRIEQLLDERIAELKQAKSVEDEVARRMADLEL
eukprot:s3291_g2.t1